MFGDTLGTLWDRFGMISRKRSENVEHLHFSKMSGMSVPTLGLSKKIWGWFPDRKYQTIVNLNFILFSTKDLQICDPIWPFEPTTSILCTDVW